MAARKQAFRQEALNHLVELDHDPTFEDVRTAHKLDCLQCELHDVKNPKSQNCRDNPYCINRIGLEKYAKLLTTEEQKAEKVEKDWAKRDIHQQPCGLRNAGNFCYMNSFLQVFFNDPVFRQAVYKWQPSPNFPRAAPPRMDIESVMTTLQKIFFCLEYTPFEDSTSHNFTDLLRLKNLQQDAQEFTLQFLSALERLLPDHPNGQPLADLIKTRYHGRIMNRTWCECGGRDNKEYQPFMNIVVPVEGQINLPKTLAGQYEVERLHECLCHACGANDKVYRKSEIVELPHVLFFQLSRYKNDVNGRRKLKNAFAYPRTIRAKELQPNLSGKDDFEYELFAVMIHEGENAHCGHYYDLIKHPFNHEWFKYNDEVVEAVQKPPGYEKTPPRISQAKAPNDMKSCYALIYRKAEEVVYSCEPPIADICQPWRNEYETAFTVETGAHLEQSSRKVKLVKRRHKELENLFSALKAHTDRFKNQKNLAVVPMTVLTDILEKEYQYAVQSLKETKEDESIDEPHPKATKLANGTSSPNKRKEQAPDDVVTSLITSRQKICPHGLISMESVLYGDVKVVSGSSLDKLLTHYSFSVKMVSEGCEEDAKPLTGADLCLECPKKLLKEAHFKRRLENTMKLVSKILREKPRDTTNLKYTALPDHFVVSKKFLQNFSKLAQQQFRALNWLADDNEIVFIPGDKLLSLGQNHVTSRTERARKRRLQNEGEIEEVEDDDSSELKEIVDNLVEKVCSSVNVVEINDKNDGAEMDTGEKESQERSPTPTSKPDEVPFNETLLCHHGGINHHEYRLQVTVEEWDELASYFSQPCKIRSLEDLCEQCQLDHEQENIENEERTQQKKELKQQFGEVIRVLEKRMPESHELGTKYKFGVCSQFVQDMRSAFKRGTESFVLPRFCNSCVICYQHKAPYKPLITTPQFQSDDPQIVPITEKEWQLLSEKWPADRVDEIIPIQITRKGEIHEFCNECFDEIMQLQRLQRLMFEKEFVFVKVIRADAPVVPDPEVQSEKKGTRRANTKDLLKFKMSHTDLVRDLKLKLYEKTFQSPMDQMLFNGDALLENEMTLHDAMIEPNNSDRPLRLLLPIAPTSQLKFDDDHEPEMGFTGTALTY